MSILVVFLEALTFQDVLLYSFVEQFLNKPLDMMLLLLSMVQLQSEEVCLM